MNKPLIIVLCSPSGGGKTTQERLLCERMGFVSSISATTREKRPEETDGIDYHFLTEREFCRRIDAGEFIEWAEVHGNLYGTLVSAVTDLLKLDSRIILNINIEGFFSIKNHEDRRLSEAAVGIFLMPPSMGILEERLRGRKDGTSEEVILGRLAAAPAEIAQAPKFDRIVTTHDQEYTFVEIKKIVEEHLLLP